MRSRLSRRLMVPIAILILAVLSCSQGREGDEPVLVESASPGPGSTGTEEVEERSPFENIGYLTRTVIVADRIGNTAEVALHLWYPSDGGTESFTYRTVSEDLKMGEFTSQLAVDGVVSSSDVTYPLVLFFHGAFTCGTQSLFLTEHLARQGFIVAAPDFPDQLRMCGQWERTDSRLKVLGGLWEIKRTDESEGLEMLEDSFRVPGASALLDEILSWDGDPDAPFYDAIDEEKVGLVGHSFGGETILGLIGPHPEPAYHDQRIDAAVILSGAVFPFHDWLGEIVIPVMVMQGGVADNTDLHGVMRREVYQQSSGPAYFLMLEGGVHGSFFNGICPEDGTVRECASAVPYARAVSQYSAAFYDLYLKGDPGAREILDETDPALKRYLRREE